MARYLDDGGDAPLPKTPITATPELISALEKINADVPVITGQTTQEDLNLTPYNELTAAERKAMTAAERTAYLKAVRDQQDANAASERAASNPLYDFTNRPDAPPPSTLPGENYIYYYSWIGDTNSGQWKLYRAPNTAENQAVYGSRAVGGPTQAQPGNPQGANALQVQPQPIKDANGNITGWDTSGSGSTLGGNGSGFGSRGNGGNGTGLGLGGNAPVYTASDGKQFTDQAAYATYETGLRDAKLTADTKLATDKAERQSAYDLLYQQFKQYGLESLVEGIKGLIQENVSPSEFSIRLQNTDAYKKRFAANQDRISKGLRALTPAEYLSKEDAYQEIMRRYGLPESYYTKGDLGIQEGFNKLIANDISDAELEDRVITAQERVINANPDILKTLKSYYPGITNGDILAYALDPKNALNAIKRKVTAAEIGVTAANEGLTSGLARAEELATAGVTQKQYQEAAPFISQASQRGTQLGSFYGLEPYNQTSAEAEALNLAGSAEAARKRKQLTGLEQASFAGQAGTAQSALDRGRQGAF